jgi:hypothetical protein
MDPKWVGAHNGGRVSVNDTICKKLMTLSTFDLMGIQRMFSPRLQNICRSDHLLHFREFMSTRPNSRWNCHR